MSCIYQENFIYVNSHEWVTTRSQVSHKHITSVSEVSYIKATNVSQMGTVTLKDRLHERPSRSESVTKYVAKDWRLASTHSTGK